MKRTFKEVAKKKLGEPGYAASVRRAATAVLAVRPIILGSRVRDQVTGFTGIVIGRTEWLTGCASLGVQREIEKGDKETKSPEWFDEVRLEVLEVNCVKLSYAVTDPGGPHPTPHRQVAPR